MSNILTAVCTVTRDCEIRYLPSGQAVLNVNVANNQGYGDKQKTLFFRVALFGKKAEGNLKDYLVKGQKILISGELSQSEYQAKDGTTKTSLELNANIIDLVGKRNESSQPSQQNYQSSGAGGQSSAQQVGDHQNYDGWFDDDISF